MFDIICIKCAECTMRAGGGAHRTIWNFMKGF